MACHRSKLPPTILVPQKPQTARTIIWMVVAGILGAPFPAVPAPVSVLTYHNDLGRSGANTNETILTRALVNPARFGKLFSHPVDGYVYAQPLVVAGVIISNQPPRNVLIVATEHDSVYAFDADFPTAGGNEWLWRKSFIQPSANITTVPSGDVGSGDIVPEIGITSTPVIDEARGVVFVEAKTKESGTRYVHRLHALDVRTGEEMPGSPVTISASVKGSGDGHDSAGNVPFNALRQMNRPALTLVKPSSQGNPMIYVAFASHGDNGPYHGWVLGYDAVTLEHLQTYNTTPNGGLGGIWMAGNGPSVDSDGNLYAMTGNGTFTPDGKNLGDSFIKLSTTGTNLIRSDWFTPFNQNSLDQTDADLGSGGTLLLPDSVGSATHPHLLVGCGKEGKIYLLDRDNMGHFHAGSDSQIVQSVGGLISGTWSSPAYFDGRLYFQGSGDTLKSIGIAHGAIRTPVLSQSPNVFGFPGATPSISANGIQEGIVWVIQSDGYGSRSPTILRAYSTDNLRQELYDSSINPGRDAPGPAVKFTVPTIANGHVYVGTATSIAVYGVGQWVATPSLFPRTAQFAVSIEVSIEDATPGAVIHYTTDGTEPTVQSPVYTHPLQFVHSVGLRAKAFKDGYAPSDTVLGTYLGPESSGGGVGLQGDYFSNHLRSFTGNPTLTRIDPTVDFDWGAGSPSPAISVDHFTARWTGQVQAQFTERYTFHVTVDDGVRLWVNGQLLVNAWFDQAPTEYTGTISLVAGKKYDLKMEYYENAGGAVAHLEWSSLSTARQVIPTSQLFPPHHPPTVAWMAPLPGTTVTGPASITLSASANANGGAIKSVAFLDGAKQLAVLTLPPYTLTWTNVGIGDYSLSVIATDDQGATTTNGLSGLSVVAGSGRPFGVNVRPQMAAFLGLPHDPQGNFPGRLSETGAFGDLSTLAPATGLLEYGVNAGFWSDGARKQRWMGIPYGGGPIVPANQVVFDAEAPWKFPTGSVFVKHFEIQTNELDPQSLRRLETRLLVSLTNGIVYGATYRWRPDSLDADLVNTAETEQIPIQTAHGTRIQTWYYPSRADCVTCHTSVSGGVLGASRTRQLNGDWTYEGSGRTDNQLRTLNHLGLFFPAVDEAGIPNYGRFADVRDLTAPISARARSFLDVNCSACHQPNGVRANFDARITTPLGDANLLNGDVLATLGVAGTKAIVPGDQLRSLVYQRVIDLDPLIKMPPLAHNEIDRVAAEVLAQWIDLLMGTPPVLNIALSPGILHLSWAETTFPYYLLLSDTTNGAGGWRAGPKGILNAGTYHADVTIPRGQIMGLQRLTSQAPLP